MVKAAHGALMDVRMNSVLLSHILALKPEITTFTQLHAFSEECRIPRTCPMKRYEGVLLEDLDGGFINWCLDQHWLDKYFRIGLERLVEKRWRHGHRSTRTMTSKKICLMRMTHEPPSRLVLDPCHSLVMFAIPGRVYRYAFFMLIIVPAFVALVLL